MMSRRRSNKGFTLVELLVVIAIIGILVMLAVPALFRSIERVKIADLETDISAIKTATILYVAEKNLIPPNVDNDLNNRQNLGIEKIKAALDDNLENISNTYGAQYKLHYYPKGEDNHNAGDFTLWIIMQGRLSTESTNKLKLDLDSMKPKGDEVVRVPGYANGYDDNKSYWNKGKTVIEVVLLNTKGLSQANK